MIKVKQAMILAAGLGSRMKELTKEIPKPMIQVEDMSLIEKTIRYLKSNGIKKIVVNTCYKAEILEKFILSLEAIKDIEIIFSREEELLGSGGGIKNALPFFNNQPFYILNSDSIFVDKDKNNSSFKQLEVSWDPKKASMLLLLSKKEKSFGYWEKGDFNIETDSKINQVAETRQYIYSGMALIDQRLFEHLPSESVAFPIDFKVLMQKNCLRGIIYDGNWYHIGDLKAFNEFSGF
jgi:N-acetyl-alpha-D-muramate 1-phosphate uridylyltransferase